MGILLTQVGQCHDRVGLDVLNPPIPLDVFTLLLKHFFKIKFFDTTLVIISLLKVCLKVCRI